MNNNTNNQFNNFNNGQPNLNNQSPYPNMGGLDPNINNNPSGYNQSLNNQMPNNQMVNNTQPNQNIQQPISNQSPNPTPNSNMNNQFVGNVQPNQVPNNYQQPNMNINTPPTNNMNYNEPVQPQPVQPNPNFNTNQFVTNPEPRPIQPQSIMPNQFSGVPNPNPNNNIPNPNLNNGINNMNNMNSQLPPTNNLPPQDKSTKKKEKKEKQKSNPIIVILLLLIIVGCIVFIVYYLSSQGIINLGFINNNTPTTNNPNSDSIKLDDSKDYVYDATYQLETSVDSYELSDGTIINKTDLIVPYINLNTPDAITVNEELNNLYKNLIDSFNSNATAKIEYKTAKYITSNRNNVLSVIVEVKNSNLIATYDYYTYNFDLTTGNFISYEKALANINYTKEDANSFVSETLSSYIHNVCDGDKPDSNQYCNENVSYDDLYNSSLDAYNQKVSDGTLDFYLNGEELYLVLEPANFSQNSGDSLLFNVISHEKITLES